MISKTFSCPVLVLLMAASWALAAQNAPSIPVDEIVKKFAENEKEAKSAWETYGYRLELSVQELDSKNTVVGEYRNLTQLAPVQAGTRLERVLSSPPPTLKRITLTSEDMKDFREALPFPLTSDDIQKYDTKYAGTEKINAHNCFVFEVKPKKTEKGRRYFQGRIWVEDQGFHIVKTNGKPVPDIRQNGAENLFPNYETQRELVGGYWFPSAAEADQTLRFSNSSVRVRISLKYASYNNASALR